MGKYQCSVCGFIYDEEAEGEKWDEKKKGWSCPGPDPDSKCGFGENYFDPLPEEDGTLEVEIEADAEGLKDAEEAKENEEEVERVDRTRGNLAFENFTDKNELNYIDNLHKKQVIDCVKKVKDKLKNNPNEIEEILEIIFGIKPKHQKLDIMLENYEEIYEGLLIKRMKYFRMHQQPEGKETLFARADIQPAHLVSPPMAGPVYLKAECKTELYPVFFEANEIKQIEVLVDEASHHFANTNHDFTDGKNKKPETDGFVYGVIARMICQKDDQNLKILSI